MPNTPRGGITRPPRGNGVPYRGINILILWSVAIENGYAAPIWVTFKQALEASYIVQDQGH
jgi:antirestriction protein ArdC